MNKEDNKTSKQTKKQKLSHTDISMVVTREIGSAAGVKEGKEGQIHGEGRRIHSGL